MENNFTQNQFEEFEKYEVLSDSDIFTKIWTEPRKIFKYINDNQYEKFFYLLMFLAGVVRGLDRASTKNMGDNMSLPIILVITVIVGGGLGWISYFIYSALLSWTGKWLGGLGNTSSIYRMMAYAMLPSIIALVLLIPQIAVYGRDVFRNVDYDSAGMAGNIIFWMSAVAEIILAIITLVFMVIGLSEVQKFSVWKSILNLILPILVIVLPILFFVGLYSIFS